MANAVFALLALICAQVICATPIDAMPRSVMEYITPHLTLRTVAHLGAASRSMRFMSSTDSLAHNLILKHGPNAMHGALAENVTNAGVLNSLLTQLGPTAPNLDMAARLSARGGNTDAVQAWSTRFNRMLEAAYVGTAESGNIDAYAALRSWMPVGDVTAKSMLFAAASHGRIEFLKRLKRRHLFSMASIEAAATAAAVHNHPEALRELLSFLVVEHHEDVIFNAAISAAQVGAMRVVRAVLPALSIMDRSQVFAAAAGHDQIDVMRHLDDAAARYPEQDDETTYMGLKKAARNGRLDAANYILSRHPPQQDTVDAAFVKAIKHRHHNLKALFESAVSEEGLEWAAFTAARIGDAEELDRLVYRLRTEYEFRDDILHDIYLRASLNGHWNIYAHLSTMGLAPPYANTLGNSLANAAFGGHAEFVAHIINGDGPAAAGVSDQAVGMAMTVAGAQLDQFGALPPPVLTCIVLLSARLPSLPPDWLLPFTAQELRAAIDDALRVGHAVGLKPEFIQALQTFRQSLQA